MTHYDITVIGAGPGGYVAAIRAAQMGAKTALIEVGEVGGVCLNRGCIPTKSLIASSSRLRAARNLNPYGIRADSPSFDFPAIMARKDKIVESLVKGIHQLIKGNQIDYIHGFGKIEADRAISVTGQKQAIESKNIILACGSTWKDIPSFKIDGKVIVTSDEMLKMTSVPKRLLIVGGGVIGSEFASLFRTFGSEVTIVEALDNLIPMEDPITSKSLERSFKKEGIQIFTKTMVEGITTGKGMAEATLSNGETVEADIVLIAVGRQPNIEGLGLEDIGIQTEKGAVVTTTTLKTNVEGIYAIGDMNGKYMLAHTASEEGMVAVEDIMGESRDIDYSAVPRPIYTDPEICSVGKTERELKEKGAKILVGRFGFGALSKALCDGTSEGQAIIYAEEDTDRLLGAQIIGPHATEIIGELTLAIRKGLTIEDVAQTIHSHPTLTEVIREATEDCDSRAIHKVYRKK